MTLDTLYSKLAAFNRTRPEPQHIHVSIHTNDLYPLFAYGGNRGHLFNAMYRVPHGDIAAQADVLSQIIDQLQAEVAA